MLNLIQNNPDNILAGSFIIVVLLLFIVAFMIFDSEDEPPGFT